VAVLAVVGAEQGARSLAPGYLVESRGLHVFSETLGWRPRRGTSALVEGRRVTINARGYRGRELPPSKPADRTRVVVLGDSIAFGLGVSDGETFADVLDARDNGIEAGNLAVQGYGPGQELLVLLGEGLGMVPDVVVLAFCLENDFADAVLPVSLYDGRTPKPRFRLDGDRLVHDGSSLTRTGPQRVVQWLSDYSYLFNRLSTLGPRPESGGGVHWTTLKREALRDEEYALRLNLAIVRRMDAVCRERGIAFVLAAFPHWFTYRSKPWLPVRFLDSLRAEGIPVLDMSDRFVARGETFRAVALDGTGHLNAVGHAIAAEELERAIAALVRPSASSPRARQRQD
jgi:lysophospholipase L1-like esterase